MNRGFVIIAQNTDTTDYMHCALQLKRSIEHYMPQEHVTILTAQDLRYGDTDPHGSWRLSNDWQVYESSPYDITIKLEADMFLPRSIDHWWNILSSRDLHICTTIRDYRGNISSNRTYRTMFDKNLLPDTYNAITYFKRSTLAEEFYIICRDVFENWPKWSSELHYCVDKIPTTDVVYGIAADVIGRQYCTMPDVTAVSMTHMKSAINGCGEDWTKNLTFELSWDYCRVNAFQQLYPLHYHVKHVSKLIEQKLNNV